MSQTRFAANGHIKKVLTEFQFSHLRTVALNTLHFVFIIFEFAKIYFFTMYYGLSQLNLLKFLQKKHVKNAPEILRLFFQTANADLRFYTRT